MGSRTHRLHVPTRPARFTVGRDHHGWWVVQDKLGKVGGLFASEDAAMHFARDESDRNPAAVCRAPEGLSVELENLSRRAQRPRQRKVRRTAVLNPARR